MSMVINVGDVVLMKKAHPCGSSRFKVLRSGADFRIQCEGCGHQVMLPRTKLEKAVRKIETDDAGKTY